MNKLAIGTAQMGLNYGIANSSGKVIESEIKAILKSALRNGIETLDTAISYGDCEAVLGKIGIENFQAITKLPAVSEQYLSDIEAWSREQILGSLKRLKIECIYGVLLHRPRQLLEDHGEILYQSLEQMKKMGFVKKIGLSVNTPEDLDDLISKFKFDLVQLPFNILDGRWDRWLKILYQQGVEIHIRSIFLQGLLLIPKGKRPDKFNKWSDLWEQWDSWLTINNITPLVACINHALSVPEVSKVIVGLDSEKQLSQIIKASLIKPLLVSDITRTDDSELLNPSNWDGL